MTKTKHPKQASSGACSTPRIFRHFLPQLLLLALLCLPGINKVMALPPDGEPVHIFVTTDPDNYIDGTHCKAYFGGYVKLAGNFTAPWTYCTNLSGTIYLDKLISGVWVQQKSVSFTNVASQADFNFPITNVPVQDWFKVRVHFTAATYLGTPLVEPSPGSSPDWYGETSGKETTGFGYCCLVAPTTAHPNASYTLGGYNVSTSLATNIDYLAPCLLNMTLNNKGTATQYQLKINGPYPYPGPVTVYTTAWAPIPAGNVIPIQAALLSTIGTVAGWREIQLIVKDDCERTSSATALCTIYDPSPTATVGFKVNNVDISPSGYLDIYTCNANTLTNTSTLSTSGWPYSYSLTLTKTDASKVPIAGAGAYSQTVSVSSFPLDLKNLPSPIGTYLANDANAGFYTIKLQIANPCTPGSPFVKESSIQLSGPPPITTTLSLNTYVSGSPFSTSTTSESVPLDICESDGYPGFKCATTGSIVSSYRRSCWTGSGSSWTEIAGTSFTKTVTGLSQVNGAVLGAGQSVPANTVIKFKLEMFNVCASVPVVKEQYFRMNSSCKKGNKPEHATGTALTTEEAQAQLISIYPNPANNFLQVDGLADKAQVEVFDMAGKRVATKSATSTSLQIELQGLSKGVYMLRITDPVSGKEVHNSKFVKE